MKKVLSAFLAVATIAGSLATAMPAAQAQHHGGHGGGDGAAIGLGILGGAIAGAAIANSRQLTAMATLPALCTSKNPPAASCASASGTVTPGASAAFRFAIDLTAFSRLLRET